jgi:hypothetical protein
MSEAQHLSDALEGLLTRSDNGWFTPLAVATAGLTAEQAATIPAPGFNSIWAIVNHVWFWQRVVALRLAGIQPDRQESAAQRGWPQVREPADEEAWQAARDRVISTNSDLAAAVARLTDEELDRAIEEGRARRYQVMQGIIAHNSYHTCEIISVRHMLGLWLKRT